jgi:hypothetical protein
MSEEPKKELWPWGRPLPRFASAADEVAFWHAHDFEPPPEDAWQEVEGPYSGSRAAALRTSSSAGIGAALGAVIGALLWGPIGAAVAGALGAGVASYVVQRRREHQASAS